MPSSSLQLDARNIQYPEPNYTMRIAIVSFFTLPLRCGNSLLAQRLADGLRLRRHSVRVFNCQHDVPEEAVHFAPQVIHALHAERCFAWLNTLRAAYRVPLVISLTGTDYTGWVDSKLPPPIITQSLCQADALVVFHEQPARAISAALPELSQKFAIIPQGVNPLPHRPDRIAVRGRYGLSDTQVVFFMAGGIRPVKNISLALEAFSRLEATLPESRLLLAGPILDPQEADLVKIRAEKTVHFTYLGDIPPLAVRELMSASDAFLNTSLHEGMSGAILEAMVEGLPIIASDIPGNRALVEDGVTGVLFPSNDLSALSHALATIAGDISLRTTLGRAGWQRARERFSAKTELDRYEALYRRVTQTAIL